MSPTTAGSLPSRIALRALVPMPSPAAAVASPARWRLSGASSHPMISFLRTQPDTPVGPRVSVVALGDTWDGNAAAAVLDGLSAGAGRRVSLVHTGAGGGSLLRAEAAGLDGTVVSSVYLGGTSTAALITAAGLLAAAGPAADDLTVHDDGTVTTTSWESVPLLNHGTRLNGWTVLVTGGLGGIGVRVAAMLAQVGAVPVIADRRPEIPAGARRHMAVLGARAPGARVVHIDLTDRGQTARLLRGLEPDAIVHCAGQIAGGAGVHLGAEVIQSLVAAKAGTLNNAVAAVRRGRLRAVLAFGSITAHGSHPGLSGYALANEQLAREMARLAARYPGVRWLTAEWSLWSGAGMARAVARTAAKRLGMVPVPVMAGTAAAVRLLAGLAAPGGITGRLMIVGAIPGAEGIWSGRPEGLPGIESAQYLPAGADLEAAMTAVAEAAADAGIVQDGAGPDRPGGPVAGRGRSDVPLLVRATVTGDRVLCAATDLSGAPVCCRRYRINH